MAVPRALSLPIVSKSISASLSVREAVGSSRMSSRHSVIMARTISSRVRWGGESAEAGRLRSISTFSSRMTASTRAFIFAQSTAKPAFFS